VTEIAATEKSIADLKKAIKSKENEVKVCQTRLFLREQRPSVEQCRDPVHYQLVILLIRHAAAIAILSVFKYCGVVLTTGLWEWQREVNSPIEYLLFSTKTKARYTQPVSTGRVYGVNTGLQNDARVHGPRTRMSKNDRGHGCHFLTPVFTGRVYGPCTIASFSTPITF